MQVWADEILFPHLRQALIRCVLLLTVFKMDQATFSNHIYQYLLDNHPLFLENIKYHDDQSFDCSLISPTGKFSVWIATYDKEITIGMDDPDETSGTHTHLRLC